MDKTDRISFSKSCDPAGQNWLLKDSGQLYIAKTINMERFLADFWSILGYSGDNLGMIRACSGWFPGMCLLGKIDIYLLFQKIDFLKIGVPCAA